jgi:hypothetical protein
LRRNPGSRVSAAKLCKEVALINGGSKQGLASSTIEKYWSLMQYLVVGCKNYIRDIIEGGYKVALEGLFKGLYGEEAFWHMLSDPVKELRRTARQTSHRSVFTVSTIYPGVIVKNMTQAEKMKIVSTSHNIIALSFPLNACRPSHMHVFAA